MFWGFGRGFGWGRGFGFGRGWWFGRGFGWGARLGYCPWTGLPRGWRWWYPYSTYGYYGYPYTATAGLPYTTTPYASGITDVNILKAQADALEAELKRIGDLINEMEKKGK